MQERLSQLPKYQICGICKNSLNQGCVEECIPQDNLKWFDFKEGTNLEDLLPFSLREFQTCMSNEARKIELAAYISKILDYLQRRRDERQYTYYPRGCRIPEDLKK